MKNLVTATNSSIGFEPAFWIDERNGNHYFIGAQYSESDLVDFDTLLDVPITSGESASLSATRSPVPLRTLVDVKRKAGPSVIMHRNITRLTDIYANVQPTHDIGSVVAEIERRLAASPELSAT